MKSIQVKIAVREAFVYICDSCGAMKAVDTDFGAVTQLQCNTSRELAPHKALLYNPKFNKFEMPVIR